MRRSKPATRWLVASIVGAAVVLGAACDDEHAGRILVAIGTDYRVPADIRAIRARVTGPDGPEGSRSFPLRASGGGAAGTFEIPLSFVIVPRGDDSNRNVRLSVEAFRVDESDPQPRVVSTRNVRGFVRGKTVSLPIFLSSACEGVVCATGQTCDRGACIDEAREATALTVVSTQEEEQRVLDSLADASAPDAAVRSDAGRMDGGPPSTLDAGAIDAGPTIRDAGLLDGGAPSVPAVDAVFTFSNPGGVQGWAVDKILDPGAPQLAVGGSLAAPAMDDGLLLLQDSGGSDVSFNVTGAGAAAVTSLYAQNDGLNGHVFAAGFADVGTVTWATRTLTPMMPAPALIFVGKLHTMPMPSMGWRDVIGITSDLPTAPFRPVDIAAGDNTLVVVTSGDGFVFPVGTITNGVSKGLVTALGINGVDPATPGDLTDDTMDVQQHLTLPTAILDSGRLYAVDTGNPAGTPLKAIVGGESNGCAYVALVECDGGSVIPMWEKPFMCTGGVARVLAVNFDEAIGLAYVVGSFDGMLAADTESATAMGIDGFVAALDSATGRVRWIRAVTGAGSQVVSAIAMDNDGRVWIGGGFDGTLDIGLPMPPTAMTGRDLFVAVLDSGPTGGTARFRYTWPGVGGQDEVLDIHQVRDGVSRFMYTSGYVTGRVPIDSFSVGADVPETHAFLIRFVY